MKIWELSLEWLHPNIYEFLSINKIGLFFTTGLQFLWGHNYNEMINVVIRCCFTQLQVLATIVNAIKYSYSVNKYNHCLSCYIKKVIVFIHSLFNIYWPCFRQHILVICGKYRDVTLKNHSFCPKRKTQMVGSYLSNIPYSKIHTLE